LMSDKPDLYPKNNTEYATKEYWDWRYSKDKGEYDWFQGSYDQCKAAIFPLLAAHQRLLQVGCGNSRLSEDIFHHLKGDVDIFNMDFSDVVIESMKAKHEGKPMKWEVMDCMNLTYPDCYFDAVIDKGTMDALMCEKGEVWVLPKEIADRCERELEGVYRVLKPGGVFIYITFAQPHFRKPVLLNSRFDWTLEVKTIGTFFHYFIYVLIKKRV